jgi:muramoyltetrapeptide carboxypeptidase
MQVKKPRRLRKGDLIALVSPASSPLSTEKIQGAIRYLESLGYRTLLGQHAAKQHGYLAGTDEDRADDFNAMVLRPEVKAIFALRGGYGSPRILPLIDYKALARQPKIISGFSDITALQLAIHRKCQLVTFSGPMPAVEFWDKVDPYTEENFWRLLTSNKKVGRILNPADEPFKVLKQGRTTGILLGGNLALVVSTFGTPFFPPIRNSLLVLEEVDEYPYRVDRMLTQLRNANIHKKVSGLLFGQFSKCEPKDRSQPHFTMAQVLQDFSREMQIPVVANIAYGHIPKKLTIPFGLAARVDTAKGEIMVMESAVQ